MFAQQALPCFGQHAALEMGYLGAWLEVMGTYRSRFLFPQRQARKGILSLSNPILVSPAHQAWPWEEQTSYRPGPNRFVDTHSLLPLTLRCAR